MKPRKLAAFLLAVLFAALGTLLLSSCAGVGTPRFTLETDYGRFSYELPELKGLKK
jgi:hypothetical protein